MYTAYGVTDFVDVSDDFAASGMSRSLGVKHISTLTQQAFQQPRCHEVGHNCLERSEGLHLHLRNLETPGFPGP